MTSININKEKFGQLIHKEKPVLVDFWAPWLQIPAHLTTHSAKS